MKLGNLNHGGIIANYTCTAACRHCLYACSPQRDNGKYMSQAAISEICMLLTRGNCRSVHIGGGEPFLNFEGLLTIIDALNLAGISLDYIETNAFWAVDEDFVLSRLQELLKHGVGTLCISFDPYHAEYIPTERPLFLAQMCQQAGIGFFLWQERFWPSLSQLDSSHTYSRKELEDTLSPKYIWDTAQNYSLHFGGRAINIEEEYVPKKDLREILDSTPCLNLLSTDHFHVDLHKQFIPPRCTGLHISLQEAVLGIPANHYFIIEALINGGISQLLRFALKYGFLPDKGGYPSKCSLCFHIRTWFSQQEQLFPELDSEHYTASLTYY